MFRSLRVPERLFAMATWLVSLVFAGFLIGLGGKIVGELPGMDTSLEMRDFIDPARLAPLRASRDSLQDEERRTQSARDVASQAHAAARNSYSAQRELFDAWIATRTATTDPKQDPEVIARTRVLDSLKNAEREAEAVVERLDATLLAIGQAREANRDAEVELELQARKPFEVAKFRRELEVFGVRLALTLPLLLVGGWFAARKRRSEYWPLMRGFVLFALYAFFFELALYLPSYGGYVRYAVGIILSAIAGVYVIRAMRRYLARREAVERQSEEERRRSLPYEEAVKRIDGGVCPGCERAIKTGPNGPANFCVHCGLRLYDSCQTCSTKKNAFYPYCPQCGCSAAATQTAAAMTSSSPAAVP